MDLAPLIQQFDIEGRLVTIQPTGSGNVNDTFLAIFRNTHAEHQVILQRINRNVFPEPRVLMENLRRLTEHVHPKLEREAERADRVWQMPRLIPTRDGSTCATDEQGDVWRALTCIPSATAFDETQGAEHAQECGTVLGHFHWLVSDLDPAVMVDPLPGFHITPRYLAAYDATVHEPAVRRRIGASMETRRLAAFIEARRGFATILHDALGRGELTLRLMHGDPKVNNIMIDNVTGKGTSIIDLDTLSPGLVQYDFGDAVRSIGNPAGEECENLNQVVLDLDLCEAFCRGYMAAARAFLTTADRAYLFDAIRLITFELGLRFFQDHLAGNRYFKVRHPEQNLNRARVQFRLCESIEARERPLRELLAGL
jgi:Ser/Thr protein kinase RdoA (MazF antagonist)